MATLLSLSVFNNVTKLLADMCLRLVFVPKLRSLCSVFLLYEQYLLLREPTNVQGRKSSSPKDPLGLLVYDPPENFFITLFTDDEEQFVFKATDVSGANFDKMQTCEFNMSRCKTKQVFGKKIKAKLKITLRIISMNNKTFISDEYSHRTGHLVVFICLGLQVWLSK